MPDLDAAVPGRAARHAPLRVALLTHSVNPRGGVVHTLELAEALHAAGVQVTVMAPAAPGQRLFRALRCAVELVRIGPQHRGLNEQVRARIGAYVEHLTAMRGAHRTLDAFDILHAQDGIGGNALATGGNFYALREWSDEQWVEARDRIEAQNRKDRESRS